jgi:hypothetical protein
MLRCRWVPVEPFKNTRYHPSTPGPGDIWVTNDLGELSGEADHASDLQFQVELRGFEPLTPSMRKAYCAFGYHW